MPLVLVHTQAIVITATTTIIIITEKVTAITPTRAKVVSILSTSSNATTQCDVTLFNYNPSGVVCFDILKLRTC